MKKNAETQSMERRTGSKNGREAELDIGGYDTAGGTGSRGEFVKMRQ
jgi:hypothetical protein